MWSTVSLLCLLWSGRLPAASFKWMIIILIARSACGRGRIRYNEGRHERRTSRCFHMDYFITEYLFSIRLAQAFYRYLSHVSVLSICWVTVHFNDTFLNEDHRRPRLQTAHLVFFSLFCNKVSLLLCVYTNKSRPFTDLFDVLLLSVRSKLKV